MSKRYVFRTILSLLWMIWSSQTGQEILSAQEVSVTSPFQRIEGRFVDIVTDLPLDDELRQLPRAFEAAIPAWCRVFESNASQVQDWHCTAFIMLDRNRFQAAGLIPANLPKFPYGYQYGDQLWISEQASAYYRRHLLLHEGTHWFMNRKYGQNGPPWLMEGMAEWLGTHRWDAETGDLQMGVVPTSRDEVPYWGRISLIQRQLASGLAPSLESIMRYNSTAHQQVDAYAWSWVAVLFFRNHPRTQSVFQSLLRRPMRSDLTLTRWFFRQLRSEWPKVRQEWSAMLAELDYGYDPSEGMLKLSERPLDLSLTRTLAVQADKSWQASGVRVNSGERFAVTALGQVVVCQDPRPWKSLPDGVTLEYHRGSPLGTLMMTIVAPLPTEADFSEPIQWLPVGSKAEFSAGSSGELHFRINEPNGALQDNSGQLHLTIEQL